MKKSVEILGLPIISITEGRELLHVRRNKGEEIVVVFNEKKHQTTTTRRGMVLWYDWQIFWKENELQ